MSLGIHFHVCILVKSCRSWNGSVVGGRIYEVGLKHYYSFYHLFRSRGVVLGAVGAWLEALS